MPHCLTCSTSSTTWPSRSTSRSSQRRTSGSHPGRAHGARSAGTTSPSSWSRYVLERRRGGARPRGASPSRSRRPTQRPWAGASQSGSTTSHSRTASTSLRGLVGRAAEPPQEPGPRTQSPLELRHDGTRVGEPHDSCDDDARQPPRPVAFGAGGSSARCDAGAPRRGEIAEWLLVLVPGEDDGRGRPLARRRGRRPRCCCRPDRGRSRRSTRGGSRARRGGRCSAPPAATAASKNRSTVSRSAAWKARWMPADGSPSLVT